MASRSSPTFVAAPLAAILLVLLAACGGGGGGGGDWYYHYACNGDSQCLATNAWGKPSGDVDVGPVQSDCTSLVLFQQKFWGPSAWSVCDQSPTYTVPGPAITGISPTAATLGSAITLTGTNLPISPFGVTIDIGGVTIPTNMGISTSTSFTFYLPSNLAAVTGPVTVHTSAGSATSPVPLTVLVDLAAVAWSGTQFLAVGAYGTALTSPDGVHWTPRTTGVSPLLYSLMAATWWNGEFLAGGTNGLILSSSDGVAWTIRSTYGMVTATGIASSGTNLVASGTASTFFTSTDGATWAGHTTTQSDGYDAVIWANGMYVMAGFQILTSPDGLTWTTSAAPNVPYYSLAWSGTKLVAVGSSGAVRTSSDGLTWTAPANVASATLFGVIWFKGQFVAVGSGGTILTSPDGASWTARNSGVSGNLRGIGASGTTAVAVGQGGVAVTSSDGVTWSSPLPPPPTGISGTHQVGQSTISWSPVSGATSYVVYASTSSSVSKTSYMQRVTSTGTSATLTGLNTNGYWYVIVTTVNAYGEGAPSAVTAVCVGPYLC